MGDKYVRHRGFFDMFIVVLSIENSTPNVAKGKFRPNFQISFLF